MSTGRTTLLQPRNLFSRLRLIVLLFAIKSSAQTNYSPLYTSSNFVKTIDLARPVGTIAGETGTTPTGGVTYTFPIFTPPGTNGLEPSISVTYNSQGGPGVVGYGWSISGLSTINRSGKNWYHNGESKSVSYTSADAFLLDGMRLNPIVGSNGAHLTEYRGETETFSVVVSYTTVSPDNPDWFLVTTKDGNKIEYGHTVDSKILTDDGQKVMMWRMNRMIDINGNYIDFKYDNTGRDSRIDEINYTGNINTGLQTYNKLKFNYGSRYEVNTAWDGGGSMTTLYLLNNIIVSHTNDQNTVEQLKKYQFNYGFDNIHSLLKEVEEYGEGLGTRLNSTIFLYGDPVSNISTEDQSGLAGEHSFYSGDFNADGISDLLLVESSYDPQMGMRLDTKIQLIKDMSGTSYTLMYEQLLPQGTQALTLSDKNVYNFLTGDFNKDSRDDVLRFNLGWSSSYLYNRKYLNNIKINYTKGHNPSSGYYDFDEMTFPAPGDGYVWLHQNGRFFIPGDFDGDGNQDYILVLGKPITPGNDPTFDFKVFLTMPSRNIINQDLQFSTSLCLIMAGADINTPIDLDGDGKQEVVVTKSYDNYSSIVAIQGTTPFISSTSEIADGYKVFPGDFNGDHKGDILVRNTNGTWKILYSTGTSFNSQSFSFSQTPILTGSYCVDRIVIGDFNGDGKSDIVHGISNTCNASGLLSVYYSKGLGSGFQYEQYSMPWSLSTSGNATNPFTPGDFNGDSRTDLLNIVDITGNGGLVFFKPFGQERLLQKITNGHNNTTAFQYKLMTDKNTYPYVYNRTVSLDDPSNQNPYNYVQLPLCIVSAMTIPDGIGGTQTTNFYYEDGVVHRYAKGFLGFKKVTSVDVVMGVKIVASFGINTQWAVKYALGQSKIRNANASLISEDLVTTSFVNLSTGSHDIRFFAKTDKTFTVDHLNLQAVESTNTYDSYGNITNNVVKKGEPSGSSVNATEMVTTTASFSIHNTPVPAKPDNITVSNLRAGMPALSSTVAYTYTTNGNLASQISFYGLPKAVTTSNAYNNYGNVTQVVTSASGLTNRVLDMVYDAKGRFITTKTESAGGISETSNTAWFSKWGVPSSQTTQDCRTTSYVYDAFGRLYSTIYNWLNYQVDYPVNWNVSGQNLYIGYHIYPSGRPSSWIFYDKLGRSLKSVTEGFNGRELTQETTYDTRGRVATKTNVYFPYIPNQPYEAPLLTTTTYDDYNRPISVTNSLSTVTTTYDNSVGGGKLKVTTQFSGRTQSKITDATGKIVSAIDDGGQLDYFYDSWGNQVEVKHGATTLITSVYDIYGKQTSLTDKNAGTTSYSYDAFGQLITQTDANNNTHNMVYDGLGKITSRTGPEGTTLYEYYPTGTCSVNKLWKVTGFEGEIKEVIYDVVHADQPSSEKMTIDGLTYTTSYNYNSWGDLIQTTYPGSVVVQNTYDSKGLLTAVNGGSSASPTLLYTVNQVNSQGQVTSVTNGSGATSVNDFYYGMPIRRYTPYIQDQNYTWNYGRGNLLSRNDGIKSLTETFQYDNLDRLISTTVNGINQLTINYDGNSSFSMGNITNKTDAGNYVYYNGANGINKIHAVAYITNPAGASAPPVSHPVGQQELSYTGFQKTASISENGVVSKEFVYGSDYERIKMRSWAGMQFLGSKYYFGDYEIIAPPNGGNSKIIYYIPIAGGNCIIMEKTGTHPKYIATPLVTRYCYTDYLGSLLTITDNQRNVIAEQNFDAWGRYRNPNTWQFQPATYLPPDEFYSRGYTGHEHLAAHFLINMNGRMYDPIMGRMLSPDNFVPDALNTQGYNRYSYAFNNPFAFTDPDGNFPWLAFIVGALFGAWTGGASANNGELNPFKWSNPYTLNYVMAGALIGGFSGAAGGAVTQSAGMIFANTAGIVTSSFFNSVGMAILTNGRVPASIGFGFGSYSMQSGRFDYLGKKGNSFLTNLGFGFGTLANLQDIIAGTHGVEVKYKAEKSKEGGIVHAELTGSSNGEDADIDISVAAAEGTGPANPDDVKFLGKDYWYNPDDHPHPSGFLNDLDYGQYWLRHIVRGEYYPLPADAQFHHPLPLYNVNGKWLAKMTENIKAGRGKWGIGNLKYGSTFFGCQSHVAQALWGVGIPTLPINWFPMMLYAQLAIRQVGIYASPYLNRR